jgi:tetratricopeptide (TPR) repeat protein
LPPNPPPGFTGAIGAFTAIASLSARELQVGEPLTLTFELDGVGNFERIGEPRIPENNGWRVYPPKVTFDPADESGLRGRKSFAYLLLPETDRITHVPEIAFAHFDPAQGRYISTLIKAEPVTVAPGQAGAILPRRLTTAAGADEGSTTGDRLAPPLTHPGQPTRGLVRAWRQPAFLYGHGAAALACALTCALGGLLRRQQRADLRRRKQLDGQLRAAKRRMRAAHGAGDAATFYTAAENALRIAASRRFADLPASATFGDLIMRLRAAGGDDATANALEDLRATADTVRFGGATPDPDRLAQHARGVDALLRTLARNRAPRPRLAGAVLIAGLAVALASGTGHDSHAGETAVPAGERQVVPLRTPGTASLHTDSPIPQSAPSQGRLPPAATTHDPQSTIRNPQSSPSLPALFDEGNIHYAEGRHAEAAAAWQSALAIADTAPLHANLGAALYQLGEYGLAALHFERALALDPGMIEARHNLGLARAAAGLEPQPPPRRGEQLLSLLPLNAWVWLASGAGWIAIACFLLPRLFGREHIVWRTLGALAMLHTLLAALILWLVRDEWARGIIITPDTPLLVAPVAGSPASGELAAGSGAVLREEAGPFLHIRSEDGRTGFITADRWEPVRR